MNCKPGDLAVIVRSRAGNTGQIVEVIRPATPEEFSGFKHRDEGFHWWVSSIGGLIKSTLGCPRKESAIPDARLRPIRDPGDDATDATDETLTWMPVPLTHRETA